MHPIMESIYCDEDGCPELYSASISRVLLFIKFRPGVRRFISSLAQKSTIHVYTKGARAYMKAIISVLDPDGNLIRGSTLAREDDPPFSGDRKFASRFNFKSLLILDDSPHIWEIGNLSSSVFLLPVDRYDFAERIFLHSSVFSFPADLDVFLRSHVWQKISDLLVPPSTPSANGGSPVGRLMHKLASFLFFQ